MIEVMLEMDEAYSLTVEEVATLLCVSKRQAHRYGAGDQPRIRTQMVDGRKLFHKEDTEALVSERWSMPHAKPIRAELVPASEMLNYIRERDTQLERVQNQLNQALIEIGRLQGQLDQRLLPEDANRLRERIAELEVQLAKQQRPFWKRLLRRS